jgi:FG-GAP repeat/FG-GAP-like repeat
MSIVRPPPASHLVLLAACAGQASTVASPSAPLVPLSSAQVQVDDVAPGRALAAVGDATGDGPDDLLVLHAVPEGGVAELFSGTAGSLTSAARIEDELRCDYATIYGDDGCTTGIEVIVGAGDLDGDGVGDLAIGEWSTTLGHDGYYDPPAAVFVFYGPVSGEHPLAEADAIIVGQQFERAGELVAAAGDVDGDGFGDLLVSTWGVGHPYLYGDKTPGLYVIHGPILGVRDTRGETFLATDPNTYAWSIASADLDGDGLSDVVVGAPVANEDCRRLPPNLSPIESVTCEISAVQVALAPFLDPWIPLRATSFASGVGSVPPSSADLDGDGHVDLVIGAPGMGALDAPEGHVYVVAGPIRPESNLEDPAATLVGALPGETAGSATAVGDLDADGTIDLAIGAPGGEEGGSVYLLYGPARGTVELRGADLRIGGEPGGQTGAAVVLPDLDADGRADVVVSAPGAGTNGAVFVFSGAELP